jgi:hypothetical protein
MNEIEIIISEIENYAARRSLASMNERNYAYEYGASISQFKLLLDDLNLSKKQRKILLQKAAEL